MTNHEHDHEHDHENEEESTVVLTDEEGNEHEFELLTILDVDNANYAVLLPLTQPEADEDDELEGFEEEAIILKISQDENGNDILQEIEDDEEWEKVAEEYERLVDEEDAEDEN